MVVINLRRITLMTKEITNDAIANYTDDLAKHPGINIASHAAGCSQH